MAANAARKSSGISPSPRFNRHFSAQLPPAFASASTSAFTSSRSFNKPASPTRANIYNYNTPSLSFSLDRSTSSNRSISYSSRAEKPPAGPPSQRRACMCSPTNHPGSFRCSLHKGAAAGNVSNSSQRPSCGSSSRLLLRRSAMKNSIVRIGTVEGELVKRALAALIRPSSHNQRRRGEFRRRPSRLSAMSMAYHCLSSNGCEDRFSRNNKSKVPYLRLSDIWTYWK